MTSNQRAGVRAVSRAFVPAVIGCGVLALTAGVWAQNAKRPTAAGSGSEMAASVNGEIITRAQVVDDLLSQIGVTRAFLRPIVKTQLLIQKLVRKDMDTKAGHAIGDADYLEAKHILVMVRPDPANPTANEKKWSEAKAKIDAILADI